MDPVKIRYLSEIVLMLVSRFTLIVTFLVNVPKIVRLGLPDLMKSTSFPKTKHLIKWYFIIKFSRKSGISFSKARKIVNQGIVGFKTLTTYDQIKG